MKSEKIEEIETCENYKVLVEDQRNIISVQVTINYKFYGDIEDLKKRIAEKDFSIEGFTLKDNVKTNIYNPKPKKSVISILEMDYEKYSQLMQEKQVAKSRYFAPIVHGVKYKTKLKFNRFNFFENNRKCVCCGLEGTKVILEYNKHDHVSQFNLYAIENGSKRVLMTQDHIVPRSKGGGSSPCNLKTMCYTCNNLKSDHLLSDEQILVLREISKNEEKLSGTQLTKKINSVRNQMLSSPQLRAWPDLSKI